MYEFPTIVFKSNKTGGTVWLYSLEREGRTWPENQLGSCRFVENLSVASTWQDSQTSPLLLLKLQRAAMVPAGWCCLALLRVQCAEPSALEVHVSPVWVPPNKHLKLQLFPRWGIPWTAIVSAPQATHPATLSLPQDHFRPPFPTCREEILFTSASVNTVKMKALRILLQLHQKFQSQFLKRLFGFSC